MLKEENKSAIVALLAYIMDESGLTNKIVYDENTKELVIPEIRFEMDKKHFDAAMIRIELEKKLKEIDNNGESKSKDTNTRIG